MKKISNFVHSSLIYSKIINNVHLNTDMFIIILISKKYNRLQNTINYFAINYKLKKLISQI